MSIGLSGLSVILAWAVVGCSSGSTGDACPGGCRVEGVCYDDGEEDAANPCLVCDAARDTQGLSSVSSDRCDATGDGGPPDSGPDGSADAGADAGDAGPCPDGCSIGGECFAANTLDPDNACHICDPSRSQGSFSDVTDGTSCDDGLFCNGVDRCALGTCSVHEDAPCADDGRSCNGAESCDESGAQCLHSIVDDAYRCQSNQPVRVDVCGDVIEMLDAAAYQCVASTTGGESLAIGPDADLSGVDLSGADLAGVDLSGADLSGADLSGADLSGADLSGANLSGADLSGADLSGADLSGADLSGADLTNANLSGADLSDADLTEAQVGGANLDDTTLEGTKSFDFLFACPGSVPASHVCVLQPSNGRYAMVGPGVDLAGADLGDADLSGLDLRRARLDATDLTGADLTDLDLRGASLLGAMLDGATLTGLRAVDLTGCPASAAWTCVSGTVGAALVGPGAVLDGGDLSGMALAGVSLNEVRATVLAACPASLPASTGCVSSDGGQALVGPGLDLSDADLSGAELSGLDLTGANVTGLRAMELVACPAVAPVDFSCLAQPAESAWFLVGPGARLGGSDLAGADLSGVDLSLSLLDGVHAPGVVACPSALPAEWGCPSFAGGGYVLVGPGADLIGEDLSGLDLSTYTLDGLRAFDLTACPADLPGPWQCVAYPASAGFLLIGPRADLRGADLTGADLDGTDMTDAQLADTMTAGLRAVGSGGCPASLPEGWVCLSDTGSLLAGPEADLSNLLMQDGFGVLLESDLRGANLQQTDLSLVSLAGADLTGADLTDATLPVNPSGMDGARAVDIVGCPADPGSWQCVALTGGGYAMVGTGVSLRSADLAGVDFAGIYLDGVDFAEASMADASLAAVQSPSGVDGCPATLPAGYGCVSAGTRWLLLGPEIAHRSLNLGDADLSGIDMTGMVIDQILTGGMPACPLALPDADWQCLAQPATGGFMLVGPGVDLYDARLNGMDLSGSTLDGGWGAHVIGCPSALPTDYSCTALPGQDRFVIAGPNLNYNFQDLQNADLSGATLTGSQFSGANLSGADLSQADLTGADLSGATLTDVTWDATTCPDGSSSDVLGYCNP